MGTQVRDIAPRSRQIRDTAASSINELRDQATNYYQQARDRATEWEHSLESYCREAHPGRPDGGWRRRAAGLLWRGAKREPLCSDFATL